MIRLDFVAIVLTCSLLSACVTGPARMPAYAQGLPWTGSAEQGEMMGVRIGAPLEEARTRLRGLGLEGPSYGTIYCGGRAAAKGENVEMFIDPNGGGVCLFHRQWGSIVTAVAWEFRWVEWCC